MLLPLLGIRGSALGASGLDRLTLIRGRPLTLALTGWLLSLGLALELSELLYTVHFVHAPLLVAVALTTTRGAQVRG